MLTERPRKENRTVASAISSDETGLSTNDGKSLLPSPNTTRKHGIRSKRRTRHRYLIRSGCVFVSMIFSFFFFSPRSPLYSYGPDNQSPAHDGNFNRKLLQTSPTTDAPAKNATKKVLLKGCVEEGKGDALFPEDMFECDQLRSGAVILHILGILYMFYALALVCDEFFVPALDVITEKLGISPDVAGATFMAAGGSAPELFTSIIGVFIAQSDVGIGTIVGSAVFNILFVIAACAFAAKEALSLTAWPLIRDVFFYSISLILLVAFFTDELIHWYEALILLLWYAAYVGFMKFNEDVEDKLRACLNLQPAQREGEKGFVIKTAKNRRGLYHLMSETVNPSMLPKTKRIQAMEGKGVEMEPLNKKEIMIGGPQPSGGMEGLKSQLKSGSAEAGAEGSNGVTEGESVEGGDDKEKKVLQHNNPNMFDGSVHPSGEAAKPEGDEEEEDAPIDMSFPTDSPAKMIIYILSFPLMAPLYITLPDTKNNEFTIFPSLKIPGKSFFIWTFLGSILWIAAFSYLMVWWATVAGDTASIPPAVMGLTFLAAGTSVPDLITSVLVAKQGKGDMAVSSSVGSNIFDVTVGLPFPWLLWTAVNGTGLSVSSKGAACSISMLFLMLILVFLSILTFKWKMTKAMGGVMLVLYVIFVIVSLGFSFQWYECPV